MTVVERRVGLRLAVVVGAAAVAVLVPVLVGSPAYAHAVLVESEPGDGAVLGASPAEVVLRFNELVEPAPDAVRVFDADGERVDAGDAGPGADRSVLRVSLLPADLPDGVYAVAWRVTSADAHPVRGSFVFTVGDPGTVSGTAAVPDDTQPGWDAAVVVARWATYAGTLLAVGGVAFLLVVHGRRPEERELLSRVVRIGAAAGVAGTVLGVPLQAVVTSGAGAGALLDGGLLGGVLTSSYGASAMVRLAGLAVLFAGVVAWVPGRAGAGPAAAGGGAAALGSFLLAGHTVTGEPRWLVWTADVAHTTAVGVWFGGLVLLAVLLRARRRAGAGAVGGAQMVARFSNLALGSVLVAATAGTTLGWAEVRTWDGLFSTGYGWTLLAKVSLVAAVVTVGGYNNRRLVPAIRRGESGDAWRALHRTVRLEAGGLLLGVLVVTAVLVGLVPARHHHTADPVEEVAAVRYDEVHPLGPDHQVRVVVDPAQVGTNGVHLFLTDTAEAAADLGGEVELRFTLPESGIDRITRQPAHVRPGYYLHVGPELSIAGVWEVEVRVLVSDFERLTITADVPVAAAPEGAPAQNHNHP